MGRFYAVPSSRGEREGAPVLLDADLDEAELVLLRRQPAEEEQASGVEVLDQLARDPGQPHAEVRPWFGLDLSIYWLFFLFSF